MDRTVEEKIVSSFFRREKAERVLYELKSKKRRECIWSFNSAVFNAQNCRAMSEKIVSSNALLNALLNNGAAETCYVMSIDESIDGEYHKLAGAVNEVYGQGPALLYFDDCGLGYLECEFEHGRVDRYLLIAR